MVGEEKTAIALSYHLTLALLLDKFGISSLKGILILDEPTTGFGAEQIENLKKIFSALPLEQIIIVSHKPELERATNYTIHVCKTNDESYCVC